MQPAKEAVLLNRLIDAHRNRRRIVFLVGAGLSLPPTVGAPGVPGAGELVRRVAGRLKESGAELSGDPDSLGYQEALELYRHHRGQRGLDELVREAVLETCVNGDPSLIQAAREGDLDACLRLERNPAAWALPPGIEEMGRLIATCPGTFGAAVLTTNFDPLVEVAIRRAGGQSHTTFLAEDGRFSARHGDGCHVIHVHGLWSGEGFTAHTVAQLTRPRPQLHRDLERFLQRSELVVLGYGGWRDVFSEVITSIIIDPAQRTEVLWCFFETTWKEIEERYAANLERLTPGLDTVVVPYAGIDANRFLPRLGAGLAPKEEDVSLSVGPGATESRERAIPRPSPYLAGPPITTDAGFFGRRQQREQIAEALVRCQPVQLLGERRMGKTSLLRWAGRHAREYRPDWPVVWVDAGALADRSPAGLIGAIGKALRVGKAVGEPIAGKALESLLPLVLLVDEAAALAAPGHRFDASFLGLLRAAGQRQELAWLSTSHADLHALFKEDHLTSPFLNDSLKVTVGALEKEAAQALLSQGLTSEQVPVALAEAGRLPYPLQWIADALFRREQPELAADALREALEPAYDHWWRSAEEQEKRLLGACVEEVALAGLVDLDRRRLRRLVDRGLVVEEEGQFTLPGAAWRNLVAERRNG